MMIPGTPKTV